MPFCGCPVPEGATTTPNRCGLVSSCAERRFFVRLISPLQKRDWRKAGRFPATADFAPPPCPRLRESTRSQVFAGAKTDDRFRAKGAESCVGLSLRECRRIKGRRRVEIKPLLPDAPMLRQSVVVRSEHSGSDDPKNRQSDFKLRRRSVASASARTIPTERTPPARKQKKDGPWLGPSFVNVFSCRISFTKYGQKTGFEAIAKASMQVFPEQMTAYQAAMPFGRAAIR